MIIVFLETEGSVVKVYKETSAENIFFDEMDTFLKKYGKENVLYVTNAVETTPKEVAKTVEEITEANDQNQTGMDFEDLERKERYLQCDKSLMISDINMMFQGRGDCKLVDEEMMEYIQSSPMLRTLIKRGTVKIIDHKTMIMSVKKARRNQDKMSQVTAARDAKLDEIIVKDWKPGTAENTASQLFGSGGGGMDITDSIVNDPTAKMTPEELNEALKNGRLAT